MHSFTKAIGGSLFVMCLVCIVALATLHCGGMTPIPAAPQQAYPEPSKEAYTLYKKLAPALLPVLHGLLP